MVECGIDTKQFQFDFNKGEQVVLAQVMFLKDSFHIYLTSPSSDHAMSNLSAAMSTRFEPMPISSNLFMSESVTADAWGTSIGQKLAKRSNAQVFVSCNLSAEHEGIIQELEQELMKLLVL
jgi:hypothetical protein